MIGRGVNRDAQGSDGQRAPRNQVEEDLVVEMAYAHLAGKPVEARPDPWRGERRGEVPGCPPVVGPLDGVDQPFVPNRVSRREGPVGAAELRQHRDRGELSDAGLPINASQPPDAARMRAARYPAAPANGQAHRSH